MWSEPVPVHGDFRDYMGCSTIPWFCERCIGHLLRNTRNSELEGKVTDRLTLSLWEPVQARKAFSAAWEREAIKYALGVTG